MRVKLKIFGSCLLFCVLLSSVISIGCVNSSDSNHDLKIGDTAILTHNNEKLSITVIGAKTISYNAVQKNGVTDLCNLDDYYNQNVDGIVSKDHNIIAIRVKFKNIGTTGIQSIGLAEGKDYGDFSYTTYGLIEPYGLYPGEEKTALIKSYSIPDKAIDGFHFTYIFGQKAIWDLDKIQRGGRMVGDKDLCKQ